MMKYLIPGFILLIFGVLLLLQYYIPISVDDHPFFKTENSKIIPHRGGKGIFPENTITAFRESSKMGFNILELDIRSTIDSVLVVFHDSTLNRIMGMEGKISDLTIDQVNTFDIASGLWEDQKIPTLTKLFSQIKNVNFIIEIKGRETHIPESLCRIIREFDLISNVLTASFIQGQTEKFRDACPEVATGATIKEMKLFALLFKFFIDGLYKPNFQAMLLPLEWKSTRIITNDFSSRIIDKNLHLYVWTINDSAIVRELLDFDVSGIITDFPNNFTQIQ